MRRPTTPHITLSTALPTVLTVGALTVGVLGGCVVPGEPDPADDAGTTNVQSTNSDDPSSGLTDAGPTGSDGDVSDGDASDDSSDADGPDPTGGDETTRQEQLEGRWISIECEPAPQADGSTIYFHRDFTLGLQSWSLAATLFGDEACSFPLLGIDIGGDYAIGAPAEGIQGAHEADFDRSSIALTPHGSDFVDWFNAEECGDQPWVAGESQDVTARGCAFVPSAADCPVEYDLVSLVGDDELYFGQRPIEGDMCSPADRPRARGEHPVVRQPE